MWGGIILKYNPENYEFWLYMEIKKPFLEPKNVFPDFPDLDVLFNEIKESFAKFILDVGS